MVRIQLSGAQAPLDNYRAALAACGGEAVGGYAPIPDLSCAGLLLCGGGDIDPSRYGQPDRGSQPPDPVRDRAEMELFHAFFQAGKPIFGICRGMQLINVALGGTLIQDLPDSVRPFHSGEGTDRVHPIRTEAGSLLCQLYGPLFSVNSAHHQAVDRLGSGLRATAWGEAGFAEGLEHGKLPIWGVQFHPERMCLAHRRTDTVDGTPLLLRFVDRCRG